MNTILKIGFSILIAMAFSSALAMNELFIEDVSVRKDGDMLNIKALIVLDSLHIGSNERLFILPILKNKTEDLCEMEGLLPSIDESISLPVIIVNGKKARDLKKKNVKRECPEVVDQGIFNQIRRSDEQSQTIEYEVAIPLEDWMLSRDTRLTFTCIDRDCGRGSFNGSYILKDISLYSVKKDDVWVDDILFCISENPVQKMKMAMFTYPLMNTMIKFTDDDSDVLTDSISDEALIKRLHNDPQKMSLEDMFLVARLYPEDSDEFIQVMKIAYWLYPSDVSVIFNLAADYVKCGYFDEARQLLSNMDAPMNEFPEVFNLLGIISTGEEDYEKAIMYFLKAGDLPEAQYNLLFVQ